jgi:hypothetical protein
MNTIRPIHVELAVEQVIADVDSFCDSLGAECMKAGPVNSEWFTRSDGRLSEADRPTLLHAALMAADRNDADLCLRAMQHLLARHLVEQDARITELAKEAA